MATYKAGTVLRDVRVLMDMNPKSQPLADIEDIDTLTISDLIASKIVEGVALAESAAPLNKLQGVDFSPSVVGYEIDLGFTKRTSTSATESSTDDTDSSEESSDGTVMCINKDLSGAITLPTDFMRLIAFKMSSWHKAVYEAVSADSAEYAKQSSPYIRGTVRRPVVAIVPHSTGLKMEFYSAASSDDTVEIAQYRPYPVIDGQSIDISKDCYHASLYFIASLVYSSLSEVQMAESMANIGAELLKA